MLYLNFSAGLWEVMSLSRVRQELPKVVFHAQKVSHLTDITGHWNGNAHFIRFCADPRCLNDLPQEHYPAQWKLSLSITPTSCSHDSTLHSLSSCSVCVAPQMSSSDTEQPQGPPRCVTCICGSVLLPTRFQSLGEFNTRTELWKWLA